MKFVQKQLESKQNSNRNKLTKNDKEAQSAMINGNLKRNQLNSEIFPVCEKMRRKKIGSKLDEINLEESKLVANSYKKNRVFELHLQKK